MTYPGLIATVSAEKGVTPPDVSQLLNERLLVFPAIVGDFEVSAEMNFEDYQTIGDGEFSSAPLGDNTAHPLLRTTISALVANFPMATRARFRGVGATAQSGPSAPWVAPSGLTDVETVRSMVMSILFSKRAVHVKVANPGTREVDFDLAVTFRSVRRRATGGLPNARYLDIDVVQHRTSSLDRMKVHFSSRFPLTHEVQAGDTFYALAQTYYGRPSLWGVIARANHSKIPPSLHLNANGRKVGTRLTIPTPPTFPPSVDGWGRK